MSEGQARARLAALIAATRDADDASGLVGTLTVAGRTLLERQVRLAVTAGAEHVVVLVERLPAALTAALDRLRRDGVAVEVARSAPDGADRFHPDEQVLVFADGVVVSAASAARLAQGGAPALLTLGEDAPPGPWERIDAGSRWAGLALVTGDTLRRTVAMLGDWDLNSTLLRRAAAAGARRLDVADGAGLAAPEPVFLVRSRAGARAASEAGVARGGAAGAGWPARLLFGPAARRLLGLLLDRPVEPRWLRWGAAATALVAVPCAGRGWIAAALLLLLAAALAEATGRLLAQARLLPVSGSDGPAALRMGAMAAALLAVALHRSGGGAGAGMTAPVLAVAVIAAMAALVRERRLLLRWGGLPPGWIADLDAVLLVFAAAAATGEIMLALGVAAGYAAVSFAAVQDRLLRGTRPG